jgi:hypothetical protein
MRNTPTPLAATRIREVVLARWRQWLYRWSTIKHEVTAGLGQGAMIGVVIVLLASPFVLYRPRPEMVAPTHDALRSEGQKPERPGPRQADFASNPASGDARTVANWVAGTGDNGNRPFAILDKREARLFVFEPGARLVGTSLVLLGSARGDDSAPGIGDKPLATIQAPERTTPAGRFVSEPGHDATGESVVWVDYDGAVAMHRVRVIDPKERRFERIATARADDKRISNGCINVPIEFFDSVVAPWLLRSPAVVYILPEVKPLSEVFGWRDSNAPTPRIPHPLSGIT